MAWLFILIIVRCFSYYVCAEADNLIGLRIVGGSKVTNRSLFAYQVSLRIRNRHHCGGTILYAQHILTAAHCCFDARKKLLKASTVEVCAGDLELHGPTETTQKIEVKYIFIHEDYTYTYWYTLSLKNDIALLRVESPFTLNNAVNSLNLPSRAPIAGEVCIVSGWGTRRASAKRKSEFLYSLPMPILKERQCKHAYKSKFQKGMLCGGYLNGEVSVCQGDSGGPLAFNGTTVVGIVSWGIKGCAKKNYPGVYTDVSHYVNWIEDQKLRSSSNINLEPIMTIISTTITIIIVVNLSLFLNTNFV